MPRHKPAQTADPIASWREFLQWKTAFIALAIFGAGIALIVWGVNLQVDHPVLAQVVGGVGTLFSASVAIAVIFEVFLATIHSHQIVAEIRTVLGGLNESGAVYGLHTISPAVNFQDLFDGIDKDEELLWLDTWAPRFDWYSNSHLNDKIIAGGKLRVLVLDPECDNAVSRAEEVASANDISDGQRAEFVKHFRESASNNLSLLRGYAEGIPETAKRTGDSVHGYLKVATYDDLPGVPMYMIRRSSTPISGYTSFYLDKDTYDTVHLGWIASGDAETGLLERFNAYFEHKWMTTAKRGKIVVSIAEVSEDVAKRESSGDSASAGPTAGQ